ncbi:MAG TPA: dihydrofolate reductase family protein [Terriglobales bacterium]|nr:dihydrofolate reductase family protein [Terriglobales bacterium]
MRKLAVFNHVSLDGYFVDANGSMKWAKSDATDAEWNEFAAENAKGDSMLLFGRRTYEMMASFWPTPVADQHAPVVAQRMNSLPKVVFSKTLDTATWNNTRLIKSDMLTAVRKMKNDTGPDLVILGSGTLVAQLAQEDLIDEYQLAVNPIILGSGRTMFNGVTSPKPLKLTKSRGFGNGNVFLCYRPAA